MARAFGISPDQLSDPAPSPFHNTQLTNIKAETAHTRSSDAAYAEWRREWLDINTAMYWHIEHSCTAVRRRASSPGVASTT